MKNPQQTFNAKLDPKVIEATWSDHIAECTRCALVDVDTPKTLALCCAEGSQYLRVLLEKAARGKYYASKAKVAALMK